MFLIDDLYDLQLSLIVIVAVGAAKYFQLLLIVSEVAVSALQCLTRHFRVKLIPEFNPKFQFAQTGFGTNAGRWD